MKTKIFAFMAISAFLMCGCGKRDAGEYVVRTMPIDRTYSSLTVSSAINVEYSTTQEQMVVSAQEKIFDYLKVQTSGSTLSLSLKSNNLRVTQPIKVVLPSTDCLSSVALADASSFVSETTLMCGSFHLQLYGASYFNAGLNNVNNAVFELGGASIASLREMKVTSSDIHLSGASRMYISGETTTARLRLYGASVIGGYGDGFLYANSVECELNEASKVRLLSDGDISGNLTGASELYYSGDANVSVNVSGASFVSKF